MDVGPALQQLIEPGRILTQSDAVLAERVELQAKKLADGRPWYKRRKPPYQVPGFHERLVKVSPLEVLHEIGRATVFQERSPLRDYQRLWAQLRYCDVFGYGSLAQGVGGRLLLMTEEALAKRFHHKTTQSEYLGIGFAIILAKRILEEQQPDYSYVPVDAEMALDAGFELPRYVGSRPKSRRGTKMRPDYFLLGHRIDGSRSTTRLVVLECKGTHSDNYAIKQLGKAAYQLDSVRVGGTTPQGLMVATVLGKNRIVAKLLDPEGDIELWSGSTIDLDTIPEQLDLVPLESADETMPLRATRAPDEQQLSLFPELESEGSVQAPSVPVSASEEASAVEAYPIPTERRGWFARVLGRTAAAGALLFAGNASNARHLVSERQLRRSSPDETPRAEGAETREIALGSYIGTSHMIHWSGDQWMEIFHGLDRRLYHSLERDSISAYVTGLGQQPAGIYAEGNEAFIATSDGTVTGFRVVESPTGRPRRLT